MQFALRSTIAAYNAKPPTPPRTATTPTPPRTATTTTTPTPPLPPRPQFISTGKQRVTLSREPHKWSLWRIAPFDRAPQWFRTYVHLSVIGGVVVYLLLLWNKEEAIREEVERATKPWQPMYQKPTYKTEEEGTTPQIV